MPVALYWQFQAATNALWRSPKFIQIAAHLSCCLQLACPKMYKILDATKLHCCSDCNFCWPDSAMLPPLDFIVMPRI